MALAPFAAPKAYKPYVPSPGLNPVSAAATTQAARSFYPVAAPSTGPAPATAPPAAAPPAAPPSTGNIDFDKLLSGDSLLNTTLAGINAQGVAAHAQEQAGIQKALVGYGGVPGGLTGDAANAVDQVTRDLASQNTQAGLSTLAKLSNAYKQSQQVSDADLAARGLLRSGAYGQHAADNLLQYNQNQDTQTQQLLDYLGGLYNGYLNTQQQLQQSAYGASNDALNRIIAMINAGQLGSGGPGGGGPASTLAPASATAAASSSAPVDGSSIAALINALSPSAGATGGVRVNSPTVHPVYGY